MGTIVGYGFIYGAYMPISNFGSGLQKALSYLPSTYATSLIKNHMLHGVFRRWRKHYSGEMVDVIKELLIAIGISWKCGKCKSDDWHYDGKYSCIWNYLLYCYLAVKGEGDDNFITDSN